MQWKHLPNRDGMFAVFDVIRQREPGAPVLESKVLKLVNGTEQLVHIY